MTTYTANPEKNGLELTFSTIPSATTRDMLKSRAWNPNNEPADKALQIDDLRAILDGLNAQKEHKQKQARAYWKRFGGSKLHAWTYSMND